TASGTESAISSRGTSPSRRPPNGSWRSAASPSRPTRSDFGPDSVPPPWDRHPSPRMRRATAAPCDAATYEPGPWPASGRSARREGATATSWTRSRGPRPRSTRGPSAWTASSQRWVRGGPRLQRSSRLGRHGLRRPDEDREHGSEGVHVHTAREAAREVRPRERDEHRFLDALVLLDLAKQGLETGRVDHRVGSEPAHMDRPR